VTRAFTPAADVTTRIGAFGRVRAAVDGTNA
jgi:hypothetical protein